MWEYRFMRHLRHSSLHSLATKYSKDLTKTDDLNSQQHQQHQQHHHPQQIVDTSNRSFVFGHVVHSFSTHPPTRSTPLRTLRTQFSDQENKEREKAVICYFCTDLHQYHCQPPNSSLFIQSSPSSSCHYTVRSRGHWKLVYWRWWYLLWWYLYCPTSFIYNRR